MIDNLHNNLNCNSPSSCLWLLSEFNSFVTTVFATDAVDELFVRSALPVLFKISKKERNLLAVRIGHRRRNAFAATVEILTCYNYKTIDTPQIEIILNTTFRLTCSHIIVVTIIIETY